MTKFTFTKATKRQSRLRLGLCAPAGGGKTKTALLVADALAAHFGGRVAVMDTEHGSAAKYSDAHDFDHLTGNDLPDYSPQTYIDVIKSAEQAGTYSVLVLDGISPAWDGEGGAMEMVDSKKAQNRGNTWAAWGEVTPLHRKFIDTILGSSLHIIATMRVRTEWATETDGKGKTKPVKIGLKPVQRDGMDYEFDVVGDLDNAILTFSKTRCPSLKDRRFVNPADDFAEVLIDWLSDGAPEATITLEQVDEIRDLLSSRRVPASQMERLTAVASGALAITAEQAEKTLVYLRARPSAHGAAQPAPAPEPEPTPDNDPEPDLSDVLAQSAEREGEERLAQLRGEFFDMLKHKRPDLSGIENAAARHAWQREHGMPSKTLEFSAEHFRYAIDLLHTTPTDTEAA